MMISSYLCLPLLSTMTSVTIFNELSFCCSTVVIILKSVIIALCLSIPLTRIGTDTRLFLSPYLLLVLFIISSGNSIVDNCGF